MKRILGVLLAVLLLFSICTAVFADELTETYADNGITLRYTEAFENANGVFYPYPLGVDYSIGTGVIAFWYLAMPLEEANVLFEKNKYHASVADEEGKLVKGATIQFCPDTACSMEKTDANGVAEFEAEEGVYTVHILNVPAGYEKNTEEIETAAVCSDIYFVLKKGGLTSGIFTLHQDGSAAAVPV